MGIADVTELALFVLLVVFVLICAGSAIAFTVRKRRGKTWREQYPHPVRSIFIRLGIAAAAAVSVFVLVAAALTLNSHRPPGENSPVIRVDGGKTATSVQLELGECDGEVTGRVRNRSASHFTIYSDGQGIRKLPLDRRGEAEFDLGGVTAKRGLLSCYVQLPMVLRGDGPSRVSLSLGDDMQVDIASSVPIPDTYSGGRWEWRCEPGGRCPVFVAVNYAIEDGAKQVIVLVLAALFGSIIALFIGEALIEPLRRRLDETRFK